MEPVTLAAAATVALAPYLIEGGKEVAKTAGKDLYGWLKGKLTPSGQTALARLEESPKDTRRQGALEVEVEDLLKAQPALMAELARLVEALPQAGHVQQAKVEGDRNVVQQAVGSGNILGR